MYIFNSWNYMNYIYIYILLYHSSILHIEHSPYCTWFDTYPQSDLVTTNNLIICIYIYIYMCVCVCVCVCVCICV